jgi:hypothetical protein
LEAPFVLPEDEAEVRRFNTRVTADKMLHLEILPEPFLGDPSAPVVLLNLNPGWNAQHDPINHARSDFIRANNANLRHEPSEYPFYLLDPHLLPYRTLWWERRLASLISETSLRAVAQNVLCVEYFPYHSKRFKGGKTLPSQLYSFALVSAAIERKAVILLMRAKRRWLEAVPKLYGYENLYEASSVQSAYVSRRNYNRTGREGFDHALAAIRSASDRERGQDSPVEA